MSQWDLSWPGTGKKILWTFRVLPVCSNSGVLHLRWSRTDQSNPLPSRTCCNLYHLPLKKKKKRHSGLFCSFSSQLIIGWDKILQSDICYFPNLGSGVPRGRSEFCSKSSACPGGPCARQIQALGTRSRQVSGKRRRVKAHSCHSTVKLCLGCRGLPGMESGAGVAAEITCLTRRGAPWIGYSPSHDPMLGQRDPLPRFPFGNRKFFSMSGFLNTWFGFY